MKKKHLLMTMIMLIQSEVWTFSPQVDSAIAPAKKKTTSLTARVHSMGVFYYMGKVVNFSPAADILFNYTSPSGWNIFAIKVADLTDLHSHNNFTFTLLNKNFRIGKRVIISPGLGAALEQQNKLIDHGSDVVAMMTTSFKFNEFFTLEHNAMFTNILFERRYSDWINRMRILFSKGHVDVTGLVWHNNGLIDRGSYFSSALSIFYNRIQLGKRIYLGAGATGIWTPTQSNPEQPHYKKGIQFTTSLTIK
jgi:hypothetical protein